MGFFFRKMNQQPLAVNEVLAEISREAVKAIVVGKDTLAAREIAMQPKARFRIYFKTSSAYCFL